VALCRACHFLKRMAPQYGPCDGAEGGGVFCLGFQPFWQECSHAPEHRTVSLQRRYSPSDPGSSYVTRDGIALLFSAGLVTPGMWKVDAAALWRAVA